MALPRSTRADAENAPLTSVAHALTPVRGSPAYEGTTVIGSFRSIARSSSSAIVLLGDT
ncbi:hypothetical protein NJ7G_2813 [Natrinema sp. J7-2]|nr:hypothetical protein NJ7G_2813 [Natrinema sp. J7-2]